MAPKSVRETYTQKRAGDEQEQALALTTFDVDGKTYVSVCTESAGWAMTEDDLPTFTKMVKDLFKRVRGS